MAGWVSLETSPCSFLPFLAVEVRRLHDTGRTGWWWLFGLIPVLGWIVLVAAARSSA